MYSRQRICRLSAVEQVVLAFWVGCAVGGFVSVAGGSMNQYRVRLRGAEVLSGAGDSAQPTPSVVGTTRSETQHTFRSEAWGGGECPSGMLALAAITKDQLLQSECSRSLVFGVAANASDSSSRMARHRAVLVSSDQCTGDGRSQCPKDYGTYAAARSAMLRCLAMGVAQIASPDDACCRAVVDSWQMISSCACSASFVCEMLLQYSLDVGKVLDNCRGAGIGVDGVPTPSQRQCIDQLKVVEEQGSLSADAQYSSIEPGSSLPAPPPPASNSSAVGDLAAALGLSSNGSEGLAPQDPSAAAARSPPQRWHDTLAPPPHWYQSSRPTPAGWTPSAPPLAPPPPGDVMAPVPPQPSGADGRHSSQGSEQGSCRGPAVELWGTCGGKKYTGPTCCAAGLVCKYEVFASGEINEYYMQCMPEKAMG